MTIADHMSKSIVVVEANLPITKMKKLFAEKKITGAPVVDKAGHLLGVVSLSDLNREKPVEEPGEVTFYANPSWGMIDLVTRRADEGHTVGDIMTTIVVSVEKDAPLVTAADLMVEHAIHRVIVTDDKKVAGVISSFDLVKEFRRRLNQA